MLVPTSKRWSPKPCNNHTVTTVTLLDALWLNHTRKQNSVCCYQNNQIFEQDSCYSSSSSEIEEKPEFEDFSSSFSPNPEKESDCMENSQNPVLNGNFKTKWQRKRAYEMTLPVHIRQKRRSAANARERKRMTNLNDAFEKLRGILPNHHRDRPLSKMEALQLAQNYGSRSTLRAPRALCSLRTLPL